MNRTNKKAAGAAGAIGGNELASNHSTDRIDREEIIRACQLLIAPGGITELRALDAMLNGSRYTGTVSGYFDSSTKIADAAASITSAKGIYIIPNVVSRELLARASNRIRTVGKGDPLTADHDIARRHWLLIDVDAQRPAGISANDGERKDAYARVDAIGRFLLIEKGWPDPIVADSGNGYHLLHRIDLPADDGGLVQRCLAALAARFDDERVKVDTTVHNPARIWKLYGSLACKGDSTADRPHRMARLLEVPATVELVTDAMLLDLGGPAEQSAKPAQSQSAGSFNLPTWIAQHLPEATGPKPWKGGGQIWELPTCPYNADHVGGSAYIGRQPSGANVAGCRHNSCTWGWDELRARFDPPKPHQRTPREQDDRKSVILERVLPPVKPFDSALLPGAFRPWIVDIANRVQCPPDFPAVASMVALAGVVGRKIAIRPKRRDDWTVVPNLWGAAIGRPGIMKTPAIQEPLKPLKRLEIEGKKTHLREVADYQARKIVAGIAAKEAEKAIRNAIQAGDGDGATELAGQSLSEQPAEPIRKRYLLSDPSVEKLGEILNQNPNGITVYRDEMVGWLRSLDKQGQECARAFYLEAWNGNGRFTYDRIGRGTVDIEAAIVSIIGGIQPGPLLEYLNTVGRGDDGMIQRFQMAVWPDVSRDWVNVDEWPDTQAKNRAYEVFTRLVQATGADLGGVVDDDDSDCIPYLRFTPEAQEVFDAWRGELERRVRSGDDHPAVESHLAKYRSLVPSLALLIHLADAGTGAVGRGPLLQAMDWAEYLLTHAMRIYAAMSDQESDTETPRLIALIERQGGSITPNDLRRRSRLFKTSDQAEVKLMELVQACLGHWEPSPAGAPGRHTRRFILNGVSVSESRANSEENKGRGYGDNEDTTKGAES